MPRGPGPLAVPGQAFNPLPGEEPRRAAFLEHESGLLLFLLGWSRGGVISAGQSRKKRDSFVYLVNCHRNCIMITAGPLDTHILGQTQNAGSTSTITLDFSQINAAGKQEGTSGLLVGAVTLAHEGFHALENKVGSSQTRAEDIFRSERNAFIAGAVAAHGLGVKLKSIPTFDDSKFQDRLNEAAYRDCTDQVVASGNGPGAINGHCQ